MFKSFIARRNFLAAAMLTLSLFGPIEGVHAKSNAVLYAFKGGADGAEPLAGLIADKAGNLYGTTSSGGGSGCSGYGCGTVFKVAADGTETLLHAFAGGTDGAVPLSTLIVNRAGKFYGTTEYGGDGGCQGFFAGCGTVFVIAGDGSEAVRYSFRKDKRGAYPIAGVIADAEGNLYGTTAEGGKGRIERCNCGTVFTLPPHGSEVVLHSFSSRHQERAGAYPYAGLIVDHAGNFYGTTTQGGSNCNCGTVFRIAPDGTETVLHSFAAGGDGYSPGDGLVMDAAGNLYGTTLQGGGRGCGGDGCGTVFKLAPDGMKTVLYAFGGGDDGDGPAAQPIMDKSGNLYGTTVGGGGTGCAPFAGCGTVFKITPDGQETILHSFTGGSDGAIPGSGALIADKTGYLYGTTQEGGGTGCSYDGSGCGTVYKVKR
ncbi:MAG TPA: choice-of-anchor tandem repeat GloVer-containing protein [Rhizomicrobium sp.]|jgi:uncharacterized repeat protein (TIGR03803 family)|nr:choice-of-anchor tandem repeat GloVer-containing protein [Rhizomicrobium sp.]